MQRLSSALSVLAFASMAVAQTIVIPQGMDVAEGSTSNAFPWGRGGAGIRIQTIYDSSHFTNQGVNTPIRINRLRWRPNTNVSSLASNLPIGATVSMSTCPVDQSAVTTTFAANQGPDLTVVYSGPVSWPAATAVAGPCPFLIDIPLQTPFLYDPMNGDLNIETDIPIQTFTGTTLQLDVHGTNPLASRVFLTTGYVNGGPNATTASAPTLNHGVVVEVSYTPAVGLFPAFTATPTSGASPLLVQFTDQSYTSDPGGLLAWQWDFDNDGTFDSTAQNPQHTYTQCGTYSVRLQVTDATGQQSVTRTNLIVTDPLVASFTKQDLGGGVYQFTDTSTPTPTAWAWDFNGDSIIDSTAQNPTFTYPPNCQVYNVSLTATLACRTSTATSSVFVAPLTATAVPFVGGNGTSSTTTLGNMFDMQVTAAEGISVCALRQAIYTYVGSFRADVYITDNTYIGKESNAAAWRLVATGTGLSAGGPTTPPNGYDVALNSPFYLPAGSYGCVVFLSALPSGTMNVAYTNGPQGPFVNPDITFFPNPGAAPGRVSTTLFTGTGIVSRCWNGSFYYSKCSTQSTPGYGFFGPGCAGTLGVPRNVATTQPRLGTTMTVDFNNLATNAALVMVGFSNTSWGLGSLPFDGTVYGAPGCFLRVSPDSTLLVTGAGNAAAYNFGPIPNNPVYLCNQFYVQAISFDPAANAAGFVGSDAAGAIIGQ